MGVVVEEAAPLRIEAAQIEVVVDIAPASWKMRSSTFGTVRMVGPMSKRKPPSCRTAALPPSQSFLS